VYTYIQSRFYRSPEVILGIPYNPAIDMWSFGCILAELYTGYPLFPGENEVEQLACVMEIFGLPPIKLIENAQRRRLFFDSKGHPRSITNSKGRKRHPTSKDLGNAIKTNDPLFLDFLRRCLEWDPTKRMNPEDALQHAWILEGKQTKRSSSRRQAPSNTAVVNTNDRHCASKTTDLSRIAAPMKTIEQSRTYFVAQQSRRKPTQHAIHSQYYDTRLPKPQSERNKENSAELLDSQSSDKKREKLLPLIK